MVCKNRKNHSLNLAKGERQAMMKTGHRFVTTTPENLEINSANIGYKEKPMPDIQLTFEYFSTFAPVSDTLLAVGSLQRKVEIDTELFPLEWMNNGYIIHTRISGLQKKPFLRNSKNTTHPQ